MIRLVTYRNFPLLDLRMQEAYRRRRITGEFVFLEQIDGAILRTRGRRPGGLRTVRIGCVDLSARSTPSLKIRKRWPDDGGMHAGSSRQIQQQGLPVASAETVREPLSINSARRVPTRAV